MIIIKNLPESFEGTFLKSFIALTILYQEESQTTKTFASIFPFHF